ncbi:hypothetical protein G6F24_017430 [Rhizopus arrhizus]|nr:hypothetical protein G6F24_017430 [Rhizopus arrhizus]
MLRAEDRGVEWRHQRCTLAACGHVAAAEVRHHVAAGQFRQQGRRIELHGIAAVRPVPDGLAVRADGGHGVRFQAGVLEQGGDRLAVQAGTRVRGQRGARQLVVAGQVQRQQLAAQVLGHGQAGAGKHVRRLAGVQADEHAVNAVDAGAGH